ncbi:MAG TPA: HlyD family efflux transporter periplasmic adaptor subunit [Desulfobulbus sp.]|nr:HlyD family efflux transporter periplasmic adaptor subunit [Desulfobulbus sp.]
MQRPEIQKLPRLRPGLRFTPSGDPDRSHFILEDTTRHQYYRIGLEEYLVLTYLNDSSTLEELLDNTSAAADIALTPEQVQTVLSWLGAKQLLQTEDPTILTNLLNQEKQLQGMRRLNRMNLISFKIPLFNPDLLLHRIAPRLSWLTGRFFALIWLVAAFLALGTLFTHWQEFNSRTAGFFSPENLVLIWLIWLGLKILHELFHALVCYRYGGKVYEAGILFILFIPLTYVDATTSWKFAGRWQRIHVALAGIFIELGVAWAALLLWAHDPDSTTGLIAHRTAIIAGISSLLFNANPLMRFDGYYVLSDLVGIPNLYQRGLKSTKDRLAQLLLNIHSDSAGGTHRSFIRIYGVLVFCWRFLVLGSLGYMAAKLFGGLGIIITLIAVLGWISSPVHEFISHWPNYKKQNPHVLRDLLLRGTVLLFVAGILLTTGGWKRSIRAPAVVEYKQQYRVKTRTNGFVNRIEVRDGDMVIPGQLLMVLDEPEQVANLEDIKLQIEQNSIQTRIAHNSGRIIEAQILRRRIRALQTRLQQLQEQVDALTITAPAGGRVIADRLDRLAGTYLKKGREILWIVKPGQKQMSASISQDDIKQMRKLVGQKVTIDMRDSGLGVFSGRVGKITPTASTRLSHPGMAAKFGGPVDVLERRVKEKDSADEQVRMEFFNPRFTMEIFPPEELLHRLWAGQIADIEVRGPRVSLQDRIAELFSDWLRKKDRAAAAR